MFFCCLSLFLHFFPRFYACPIRPVPWSALLYMLQITRFDCKCDLKFELWKKNIGNLRNCEPSQKTSMNWPLGVAARTAIWTISDLQLEPHVTAMGEIHTIWGTAIPNLSLYISISRSLSLSLYLALSLSLSLFVLCGVDHVDHNISEATVLLMHTLSKHEWISGGWGSFKGPTRGSRSLTPKACLGTHAVLSDFTNASFPCVARLGSQSGNRQKQCQTLIITSKMTYIGC